MFSILLTDNQYDLYMNLCSFLQTLSYKFRLRTTCGLYFAEVTFVFYKLYVKFAD